MSDDWLRRTELSSGVTAPLVQALTDGELDLVVLPRVIDPTQAMHIVDATRAIAPTRFAREFEAFSFGPCLDQAEGDLDGYLARVAPFEAALAGAPIDVVGAIVTALTRVSPGLTLTRPASDGRTYGLVTLRALPPGGLIPPHCEIEQLPRRSYDALRAELDPRTLLSFYVTLDPGEAGGALSIHDLGPESIRGRTRDGHSSVAAEVARARSVGFRFEPGTMVLFDGGRHFHQILPVERSRTRWTLGGFVAQARDGKRLFAWA